MATVRQLLKLQGRINGNRKPVEFFYNRKTCRLYAVAIDLYSYVNCTWKQREKIAHSEKVTFLRFIAIISSTMLLINFITRTKIIYRKFSKKLFIYINLKSSTVLEKLAFEAALSHGNVKVQIFSFISLEQPRTNF